MTASSLAPNCPPRLLTRPQAAAYLSISVTKLDELVKAGDVPAPGRIGSRVVFNKPALDRYADSLAPAPDDDANSFD